MYEKNDSCICESCPWKDYCFTNMNSEYVRGLPFTTKEMAIAMVGGENISGIVTFVDVPGGTEVKVNVNGLPNYQSATPTHSQIGPFGFHIHDIGNCAIGDSKDPFKAAGGHFNPLNQPHGNHPGDFPVLFSNNGRAEMTFFTNRFKIKNVIGKSVVIHEGPDDYKSQPAGNSGKRIACGVIVVKR